MDVFDSYQIGLNESMQPNDNAIIAKTTPPLTKNALLRPRLFEQLEQKLSQALIYVMGPPGAGKTTLVASFLSHKKTPVLWYQVDPGDNDAANFFYFLSGAARKQCAPKNKQLPQFTADAVAGLSAFTRQFFTRLFSQLKKPFVLVLDNYHEIPADSLLHEVLREGFSAIPAGINVILISRGFIPPALARFQANQNLSTLEWDDLRFTPKEFSTLLNLYGKNANNNLTVDKLYAATQGWAAGLVLLHQQPPLQNKQETWRLDSKEALFNYFSGEIFQRIDKTTQKFLLETALLPQFSVETAQELTGIPTAKKILTHLHQQHFFTSRLNHSSAIYQYHPLFREFLLAKIADHYTPVEMENLKNKTAALLISQGQIPEAMQLFLDAENWEGMTQLITEYAHTFIAQGRAKTLIFWLETLPQQLVNHNAQLLFLWAQACLPYTIETSRRLFTQAYHLFLKNEQGEGVYLSWSGAVETFFYAWGDFSALDYWIEQFFHLENPYPLSRYPAVEIRVAPAIFSALVLRQPRHAQFHHWETRLVQMIGHDQLDIRTRLNMANQLMLYYTWMGQLGKIAEILEILRPVAQKQTIEPATLIIWHSMEAMWNWLKLDLKKCIEHVERGLQLSEETGIHFWDVMIIAQGVYGALSMEAYPVAQKYLKKMKRALSPQRHLDAANYHYLSAWADLLLHNEAKALRHAQASVKAATKTHSPFPQALAYMALAQTLFEQGAASDAFTALHQAQSFSQQFNSLHSEYHVQLLTAYFHFKLNQENIAQQALQTVCTLGKQHRYYNMAWWRPDMMSYLCVKALKVKSNSDYAQELIRRRQLAAVDEAIYREDWPWDIRIYALGQFSVVKQGQPLQFATKAQRRPLELLKVIVALGAQNVAESNITAILWPSAEGDTAHCNFDTTLYRLRKLLGHYKIVNLQDGRLSLDYRYCWCDVWAFERAMEELGRSLKGSRQTGDKTVDSLGNIDSLGDTAISLYKGAFLGPDCDQAWSLPTHERLRSKFLRQINQLGFYWEQQSAWQKAIDCYLQGIEVDNLAEVFYQKLMGCYLRLGRRAEGIAVYVRCAKMLKAVLEVPPNAETHALLQRLKVYTHCV